MLNNIGIAEILVVILVLAVLFGKIKLPDLSQGITEAGKELDKVQKKHAS